MRTKMASRKIIRRGFIDNSCSVYKVAKERTPITWESVFEGADLELKDISNMLEKDEKENGRFVPNKKDIFAAFEKTKLLDVSVVIFGQEPYTDMININGKIVPKDVGMAYSVRKGDNVPPVLKSIYKELYNSIENFVVPEHGDLSKWASQGVLLLNACLTINPKKECKTLHPKSCIWMDFVTAVIKSIVSVNPQTIFVLWGRENQKLTTMLGDRSVVLTAAYPTCKVGFLGCDHFNEINIELEKQGKNPINWNLVEPVVDYVPFNTKCSDEYKKKSEQEKVESTDIVKLVPFSNIN